MKEKSKLDATWDYAFCIPKDSKFETVFNFVIFPILMFVGICMWANILNGWFG